MLHELVEGPARSRARRGAERPRRRSPRPGAGAELRCGTGSNGRPVETLAGACRRRRTPRIRCSFRRAARRRSSRSTISSSCRTRSARAAEIRRDYAPLAAAHARRADAVITSTQHGKTLVADRLGVPADRIYVCPPGAPAWRPARPRAQRARRRLRPLRRHARSRARTSACCSTPTRRCSARRASAPHLVLAGRADRRRGRWLERIARPPLAGHVTHLGYVAPDAPRALYAGARLLVLPSLDEGFGLPALEAMSAGIPVVVVESRLAARGRRRRPVRFVEPDDVAGLAAAIERLASDDDAALEQARAGTRAGARVHVGARRCHAATGVPRRRRTAAAARRPGGRKTRSMKIAIDARELHGKPTGVGRYLSELLAAWKAMPAASAHEFVLLAPENGTAGTTVGAADAAAAWSAAPAPTCCSRPATRDRCARPSRWSWPSTTCRLPRTRNGSRGARGCGAACWPGGAPAARRVS